VLLKDVHGVIIIIIIIILWVGLEGEIHGKHIQIITQMKLTPVKPKSPRRQTQGRQDVPEKRISNLIISILQRH
jgi:hypothetical protein